jgi:hypothetical protein
MLIKHYEVNDPDLKDILLSPKAVMRWTNVKKDMKIHILVVENASDP